MLYGLYGMRELWESLRRLHVLIRRWPMRCIVVLPFICDDLMMRRGELELELPSSAHLHVMIEGPWSGSQPYGR